MPETQPPPAPPPKTAKSFQDPAFIKILDAAYANTAAIKAGQTPTQPTDSPDAPSPPSDGAASSGAAKPAAAPNTTAAAAPPSQPAAETSAPTIADPPFEKRTSAHWEALRATHKQEMAQLRAELEAAKRGGDATVIEQMKAQLDEYQRELRMTAIERDPVFRNEWNAKQTAAINRLKAAAGKNGEQLAAVAQLPGGEQRDRLITELLGDLTPWKAAEIGTAMSEIGRLEDERRTLVERTRAQLDQQAQLAEANRIAEARQQSALFDEEVEVWKESLDALAASDPGKVESAIALARNAYAGKLPIKQLAKGSMWIGVGPLLAADSMAKAEKIANMETAHAAEVAALKATIAKLSGGQPLSGGQAPAPPNPAAEENVKPPGMSLGEWAAHLAVKGGHVVK